MIAKDDLAMTQAAETLFALNADEQTRARAQARREYLVHEQAVKQREEMRIRQIGEQAAKIEEQAAENKRLRAKLASIGIDPDAP